MIISMCRYRELKEAMKEAKEAIELGRKEADPDLIKKAKREVARVERRKLELLKVQNG